MKVLVGDAQTGEEAVMVVTTDYAVPGPVLAAVLATPDFFYARSERW